MNKMGISGEVTRRRGDAEGNYETRNLFDDFERTEYSDTIHGIPWFMRLPRAGVCLDSKVTHEEIKVDISELISKIARQIFICRF